MSGDDEVAIYDEIEIEDMTFDEALQLYHYPCPCGDRFQIALDDLRDEQDIAVCPSCSLMIRVIFDLVCFGPCCFASVQCFARTDSTCRRICRNLLPPVNPKAKWPLPPLKQTTMNHAATLNINSRDLDKRTASLVVLGRRRQEMLAPKPPSQLQEQLWSPSYSSPMSLQCSPTHKGVFIDVITQTASKGQTSP